MQKTPEWLKYNTDGSADITLAKPVDISGTKVSVVRMREPTVADQEAASEMAGSDAAREIGTFANLCQLAPGDIRQLSLRDYKRLQVAYLGFID